MMTEEIKYVIEASQIGWQIITYGAYLVGAVTIGLLGLAGYKAAKHIINNKNSTERTEEGDLPKIINNQEM